MSRWHSNTNKSDIKATESYSLTIHTNIHKHQTYRLSLNALSVAIVFPLWNHSTLSTTVPVIEQLKIAVPPEFIIWTCGWICTDVYEFTFKRISTLRSPNWFDALHTYTMMTHIYIYIKQTLSKLSWEDGVVGRERDRVGLLYYFKRYVYNLYMFDVCIVYMYTIYLKYVFYLCIFENKYLWRVLCMRCDKQTVV